MTKTGTKTEQAGKTEPKTRNARKTEPKLVKMVRDGDTADVHPNEVEHMTEYGWSKE